MDLNSPHTIAIFVAGIISLIILGFAVVVLISIIRGDIKLTQLVSEPPDPDHPERPPKASLSRFQFLIFTFVIAGLYLVLSLESGSFIDIPESVLVLLGISGGSYLVSKGIGKNGGAKQKDADTEPTGA